MPADSASSPVACRPSSTTTRPPSGGGTTCWAPTTSTTPTVPALLLPRPRSAPPSRLPRTRRPSVRVSRPSASCLPAVGRRAQRTFGWVRRRLPRRLRRGTSSGWRARPRPRRPSRRQSPTADGRRFTIFCSPSTYLNAPTFSFLTRAPGASDQASYRPHLDPLVTCIPSLLYTLSCTCTAPSIESSFPMTTCFSLQGDASRSEADVEDWQLKSGSSRRYKSTLMRWVGVRAMNEIVILIECKVGRAGWVGGERRPISKAHSAKFCLSG